jgi:O-antigen/teichoic acid export membrane protein
VSLKKNVVANFAGSAWIALMSLAFVPAYIRLMGVEAYGIVGVFASLMAMLAVLDLGLSQAMNREMARLSGAGDGANRLADTARTLEVIYWGIALLVAGAVALLANPIAYEWLNPDKLSRDTLRDALWVMAVVIGLRWPVAIYVGGLNGLQRQVSVNWLLALFATLQGAGALLVLWFIEPSVRAFFVWQAMVALLQVLSLRVVLWRCFNASTPGVFKKDVLRDIWRFASGMTGIGIVSIVLTQLDKVLLSKLLSLTEFGYYTFAATVAGVMFRIIGPIFTAYAPRMTELVAKSDEAGLSKTYHQASQMMAVAILPAAFTIAFFSEGLLSLWTGDAAVVSNASKLISLLVLGNALNGLMHIPYALQLAYGWTKLALYQNVVAVVFLVPAVYWAVVKWGTLGAAGIWLLLNAGYFFISPHVMHQRLLSKEKWPWYWNDVCRPLFVSLFVVACFWGLLPADVSAWALALVGTGALLLASVLTVLSSSELRQVFTRN